MPRKDNFNVGRFLVRLLVFLFSIALVVSVWDWVGQRKGIVLLITGGLILILIILKFTTPRRISKKINNILGF